MKILSEKDIKTLKKKGVAVSGIGGGSVKKISEKIVVKDESVDILKEISREIKNSADGARINADAIKSIISAMIKMEASRGNIGKVVEKKVERKPIGWEMDVVRGDDGFITKVNIKEKM